MGGVISMVSWGGCCSFLLSWGLWKGAMALGFFLLRDWGESVNGAYPGGCLLQNSETGPLAGCPKVLPDLLSAGASPAAGPWQVHHFLCNLPDPHGS
jgi:hypothetical protein